MIYLLFIVPSVLMFMYVKKKMLIEINVLQLHSYENENMKKWVKGKETKKDKTKEFWILTSIIPLIGLLFVYGAIARYGLELLSVVISSLVLFKLLKETTNPNTKKPLVVTDRVKRILKVCYTIVILTLVILKVLVIGYRESMIAMMIVMSIEAGCFVALSKLTMDIISISNNLMKPVEKKINEGYIEEARQILKENKNLKVIGITGSFGKTSTKFMVAGLLAEKFNVCKTPGSYNTLLGVVRTIREQLDEDDEIFVCEMGARHPGDIKEICDLVNPDLGIITAIGDAHLESFGSIETTKETKFELARSLDNSKSLYVNIDNKNIKDKLASDVNNNLKNYKVVTYSLKDTDADFYATNIDFTGKGARFDVIVNGKEKDKFTVYTKLLGLCNIYNVLGAIAIAWDAGLSADEIVSGALKLKPVEHRLEILNSTNQITVIDDTFNANPEGTKEALEVLKRIEGNKKIIITPGMTELGEKEYELNKEFGRGCAKNADYTIMVGYKQTKPMQDAFKEENVNSNKFYVAENLDDASEHLRKILELGDVVLYENDMPEDV